MHTLNKMWDAGVTNFEGTCGIYQQMSSHTQPRSIIYLQNSTSTNRENMKCGQDSKINMVGILSQAEHLWPNLSETSGVQSVFNYFPSVDTD